MQKGIKYLLITLLILLMVSPALATDRRRLYDSADTNLLLDAHDGTIPIAVWGGDVQTKTDTNANDANTQTTETDTVVWTPASAKKIVLTGVAFTSEVATTLIIETGTTAVGATAEVTASGLFAIGSGTPIWIGDADDTLTYTVGSAGRHSILMYGYEID